MHVLVTGGAGFIGSHIIEFYLNKGDKVHAIDDLTTGSTDNIAAFMGNPNFRFDKENVLTWSGVEKAATWADYIFHMAAVVGMFRVLDDPVNTLAVNIAGCERLLRAARAGNWKPVVFLASSSEVYGSHATIPFKEDMVLSIGSLSSLRWNYATSKLANETFGLSYAKQFDMHVTIVRLFNTIGPRQTGRYGMVVPRFVKQAVNNKPITVFGDGTQTRCFCDVRDTVVAFDRLASNPNTKGQIVNVGNTKEIAIKDLAALIKTRAESSSPITYLSYTEAYGKDYEDVFRRKPSLEKLTALTKFKHKWSLEKTVDTLIGLTRASSAKGE